MIALIALIALQQVVDEDANGAWTRRKWEVESYARTLSPAVDTATTYVSRHRMPISA